MRRGSSSATWLTEAPFAHRGLHGAKVPENSLAAFDAARKAGFGVELDVRATLDGVVVVFHDASLRRMTGRRGSLATSRYDELRDLRLKSSNEPIPTLERALERLGNDVPVLVELKPEARSADQLTKTACELVRESSHRAAVMSSDLTLVQRVRAREPAMVCGWVVQRADVARLNNPEELWGHNEPNFLAYDLRTLPHPSAQLARAAGLPVLTWTVRSRRIQTRLRDHVDNIIFEKFLPQPE